ncbi:MAG: sulfite exporter TauE/SafE family protein [Candidatus Omnitrophica bacterium]|nr:sulfite exporter TauE/SafE family protein [Candidatus Omnitrophota bacterium]
MSWVLYVLVGVIGGVISGLFGVGGGLVIVPILVLCFGFTQHMAQGTMLLAFLLPSFIFATWKYYQAGNVNVPVGLYVALGMLAGSWLGAVGAHTLSDSLLKKLFGALMVVSGLRLMFW